MHQHESDKDYQINRLIYFLYYFEISFSNRGIKLIKFGKYMYICMFICMYIHVHSLPIHVRVSNSYLILNIDEIFGFQDPLNSVLNSVLS